MTQRFQILARNDSSGISSWKKAGGVPHSCPQPAERTLTTSLGVPEPPKTCREKGGEHPHSIQNKTRNTWDPSPAAVVPNFLPSPTLKFSFLLELKQEGIKWFFQPLRRAGLATSWFFLVFFFHGKSQKIPSQCLKIKNLYI